ncbi:MAG: fibrobacter succinogenes major paralogous domain-containing protein [Bacteroidales bacterium]|nr:fibrobacter succinogenes major paralogous domain-containing protein [Bacteroidales bacterium]
MKKLFTIITTLLLTSVLYGQSPDKMSYQSVVRNSNDQLVTDQLIGMQISVLQGSTSGIAVYVEQQYPTSNANGLVTLEIGNGIVITGVFSLIEWSDGPYFLKTETDPNGGTSYTITGISQLLSVPYALHSKTADSLLGLIIEKDPVFGNSLASGITQSDTAFWNSKLDVELDSSVTNELQMLSRTGLDLTLSNGGGSVNIADNDNDPNNELQTLGQSGTNVTLSNGGGIVSVDDADNDPTNEFQTVTKTGSTVTLSDGGGSFNDDINDADNDPNNELQTLLVSGNTLTISNGNSVNIPIEMPAGTLGGTIYNNGSQWVSDTNLFNKGDKIGIGTTIPTEKLDIKGNTRADTMYASAFSSNSPLLLQTNGNTRIYVDDSTGYVGIANTSPTTNLHIDGGFKLNDGTQGKNKVLTSDASGKANWVTLSDVNKGFANLSYPDGADGITPITVKVNSTNFYSVPIGRNLYILNIFSMNNNSLEINGNAITYGFYNYGTGAFSQRLSQPIVVGHGDTVGGSDANDITINGYLVRLNSSDFIFYCGVDVITDSRDGKSYKTVQMGNQCWMAENLNIGNMINATQSMSDNSIIEKYCYDNIPSYCDRYGGLYQWNEMMDYVTTAGVNGICPKGWHLPIYSEWETLTNFIGGLSNPSGNKLKSCRQVNSPLGGDCNTSYHPRWRESATSYGTDDYGFSMLPSGFKGSGNSFNIIGVWSAVWTSSVYSSGDAYYLYVHVDHGDIIFQHYPQHTGLAVRCLKD